MTHFLKLTGLYCLLGSLIFFTSCEKEEPPIVLPQKTGSTFARVEMGEDYKYQVFYDLENEKVVKTSEVNSWDLCFDAAPNGYELFMNGGKNWYIYKTGKTSMADVNSSNIDTSDGKISSDNGWLSDKPSMLPGTSGLGNWRKADGTSKYEVYVMSLKGTGHFKFRLIQTNAATYTMEFCRLDANSPEVINIPKDSRFSKTFFSVSTPTHLVFPEPEKSEYDIVFTRYRHIYTEAPYTGFHYILTGVLLNEFNVTAAADSTESFADINAEKALTLSYFKERDVIGFDWKSIDFATAGAQYVVNSNKNYCIRTRNGRLFKLHFLDFKSPTQRKGSPSFEFERLQ